MDGQTERPTRVAEGVMNNETCRLLKNNTVMNFIPIPIPTELKVDKVNIMLIKS